MRLLVVIFLALTLSACRDLPDYPVPDQSPTFENFTVPTNRVVDFARAGADPRIFRDIIENSSVPWRWTLQHPAVKIKVGFKRDLKYVIDFTIPDVTFKDTGPVTITFTLDDHVLDRIRYEAPGAKRFEKPIPSEWIEPHTEIIAGADIDKIWVAKADGARLGFILSRIGLVEK